MNTAKSVVFWSIMLVGCISTDLDEHPLPTCASREASALKVSAVVQLSLGVPPYEECNAVAIAPTLLLTTVNCVTTLVSQDENRAGFTVPRCMPSGAPIEDGSFLLRYAQLAAVGSLTLSREDGSAFEAMVAELFVSSAASTCMADLALLRMQLALDVPLLPIRLDPQEVPGDDVTIVGFVSTPLGTERQASPANILESTFDQGSSTLPARSLLLSGDSCAKAGSAVIATDTGALIGLLQPSARTITCTEAETASPVAVRVAPFRRFLLEGAREAQTSLIAEYGADATGLIPLCADP